MNKSYFDGVVNSAFRKNFESKFREKFDNKLMIMYNYRNANRRLLINMQISDIFGWLEGLRDCEEIDTKTMSDLIDEVNKAL